MSVSLPQPFGLYQFVFNSDYLHFGCWEPVDSGVGVPAAQHALSQLLRQRLPPPPARVLDVGCGLGATAEEWQRLGYEVTALAPSDELIAYAAAHHPGPHYLSCGFLDERPELAPPQQYDVVLFQESLQYFPDLAAVFDKAVGLLAPGGRVLLCDEVSYDPLTRQDSAVHEAREVERQFSARGLLARYHRVIGANVAPTCVQVTAAFERLRPAILERFGEAVGPTLDHYLAGWRQQLEWYRGGQFGYEVWELQPSRFHLQTYQSGQELTILQAFEQAFNTRRELAHWHWKYRDNPYGGPRVCTAWEDGTLAAHYTGYPVPLWHQGQTHLTYQAGDTFTLPAYRGQGRGSSSLLARVARLFYRLYCERAIPFLYGFNTGRVQRFGKTFLGYSAPLPVHEWVLEGDALGSLPHGLGLDNYLRGYRMLCVSEPGDWADPVFAQARHRYGSLLVRDRRYLHWRYALHPEHQHYFFVIFRWGRPLGWWLGRIEGHSLRLGDALFADSRPRALQLALGLGVQTLRNNGHDLREVRGWFSDNPGWWEQSLRGLGFRRERQCQQLDLCLVPFDDARDPAQIGAEFYFTQGDSDLF